MLFRYATFLSAAAVAMAIGATPSVAQDDEGCDMAALAEIVKASGASGDGAGAAVEVVEFYAPNACAVGRQDVNMIRGMMSDAYGAAGDDADARAAALAAAKSLTENAAMECSDKDGKPLMVLNACTLEDVQKAASGG